jgi:hypothetical protein
MGSIWLHNLPDALEGMDVRLWSGWENRSRSSGGFNALMGVIVHHTASQTSLESDCNWMWNNPSNENSPVGSLYLARDGQVVIGCAGAANTAGKGGPWTNSKGTVPLDQGNSNTINIEAGNNGVGEQWPTAQQDAYVELCARLCAYYDFDPLRDIYAHFEWAPTRKIDPAGNSRYASGGSMWNMDLFRGDVEAKASGGQLPIPEEEEVTDDDVQRIAKAVWKYMTTDLTVDKPVSAEYLLQCTRGAAANGDRQTRAGDAKNSVAEEVWGHGKRTLTS